MDKKLFYNESFTTEIARCNGYYIVGLVRSLKSSHKEALKKPLLCEDNSDLTSPTRNHIQDICITISVAYDTF